MRIMNTAHALMVENQVVLYLESWKSEDTRTPPSGRSDCQKVTD